MATLDEFRTQATTEVESEKPLDKNVNGVVMELDDDDYAQMIEDRANYYYDQQENGYKNDRQSAYAQLSDQLDMIYWDKKNDTTTWVDHIDKVKADNPKPS
jgi:hypothetical protein